MTWIGDTSVSTAENLEIPLNPLTLERGPSPSLKGHGDHLLEASRKGCLIKQNSLTSESSPSPLPAIRAIVRVSLSMTLNWGSGKCSKGGEG